MAVRKNSIDGYGKLLLAALALPQTFLSLADALAGAQHFDNLLFGLFFANDAASFAYKTALRTDRAIGPTHGFEVFTRFVFVLKVRL